MAVINSLIAKYEPAILNDKELMPTQYIGKLLKGIVGFRVDLDRIDAKEKLGQHKSKDDQQSVFNALKNSQNIDAQQLADYMQLRSIGNGNETREAG